MTKTLLLATLLFALLFAGVADAQTVVAPNDVREIVRTGTTTSTYSSSTTTTYSTYVGGSSRIQNPSNLFEARLFFEFDLSSYGTASAAVFKFSAAFSGNGNSGLFYLKPMTSGEDGTVTTSDFSLLGAPIWTGSLGANQSFSIPVTSWFNSRAGGFGGFALTAALGTSGSLTGGGNIQLQAVPEPGTIALFGFGLASLFVGHRIRQRRKRSAA